MKNLMNAFYVMTAVVMSASAAHATSVMPSTLNATITRTFMHPQHTPATIQGGNVTVNYIDRTVTLTLFRNFHCPKGAICAQVMPAPMIVKLPIVNTYRDRCDVLIIQALDDARPRDGLLRAIELRDNQANRCPQRMHLQRAADTQISYMTLTPGMGGPAQKAVSRIEAGRLAPRARF